MAQQPKGGRGQNVTLCLVKEQTEGRQLWEEVRCETFLLFCRERTSIVKRESYQFLFPQNKGGHIVKTLFPNNFFLSKYRI